MNRSAFPLALIAVFTLQACSKEGEREQATQGGGVAATDDKNMTEALAKQADLTSIAAAVKSTGLGGIFANAGSYTLIAPTNAAFAKLGEKSAALTRESERAALTAVIRDHLLPGYLTRDDIAKAIDANGGKAVKMRSLGKDELSFSRVGARVNVAGSDGSSGTLGDGAVRAGPSIALPVDAVLKKL